MESQSVFQAKTQAKMFPIESLPCGLDPAHEAVVVHVPHGARAEARRDQRIANVFVAAVADLAGLILVAVNRNMAIFCWYLCHCVLFAIQTGNESVMNHEHTLSLG